MNRIITLLFSLFLLSLVTAEVNAQKLPFQGRLLQNNNPVNDTLEMTFSIDSIAWTETHPAVPISDGLYAVVLGEVNPLPKDLFSGFTEHTLNITIGGVSLTPVQVYPALSEMSTRYSAFGSQQKGDTAVYYEITGGADSLQYFGLRTNATTAGSNIGTYGKATSQTGTSLQVGSWGRSDGTGVGSHYGVVGQANSQGKNNIGVFGSGSGAGDGSTGIGTGSYNTGVSASASGNAWGNTGVFGNVTGTQGVDNIGVVGWSSAGTDTTENKGILGWAKGIGINKGVMGIATGGVENWAGWFEGNVKVLDGSMIAGTLADNRNTQIKASGLNLSGPSTQAMSIGFKDWDNPNLGFIHIYDTAFAPMVQLQTNYKNTFQEGVLNLRTNEDGRNIGLSPTEILIHGPNSPNVQLGGKHWENMNLANLGMFGSIPDGGGWYFTGVNLVVNSDGVDKEWGNLSLNYNNSTSTTTSQTAELTGNLFGSNGGGLILSFFDGTSTINNIQLNGADGTASFAGQVTVEGGTVVTSDRRYKDKITTLENSLSKVNALRGVSYTIRKKPGLGTQIGVIAQEVEEVYPEFVHTDKEGYKAVNYAQMVAVLIEAVKELNTKIADLENQNAQLSKENNSLQAQLKDQMDSLNDRLKEIEKLIKGDVKASSADSSETAGK
ncbi:MAG: tail fiber domain-containing protein [Candidatus Cyclobacteriaceae bacterium M2_1C_046]